jgi:hypothetical protein
MPGINLVGVCRNIGPYLNNGRNMETGNFYFLKEKYFRDFDDSNLMKNKEMVDEKLVGRPFFYSFEDDRTGLFWFIPLSSKVEKFKIIYDRSMLKYGRCDTLVFGKFRDNENVFLIQNMCPTNDEYVADIFIDSTTRHPYEIERVLKEKIISNAKRVLYSVRRGRKLIFPDVLRIEKILLSK